MFFYGVHEVKKRVIEFLQDALKDRPLFEEAGIFNHHPNDRERQKTNIIITGSSMDTIQLSPDNFLQTDIGYAAQAKVTDATGSNPGYFLSWVRDDYSTYSAMTDRVDPAVYYFTVKSLSGTEAVLQVDVLGVAKREAVLYNYTGESAIQLENYPVVEGSFQLFVNRGLYASDSPADFYDLDNSTGVVTFNRKPAIGSEITASYNWQKDSLPDQSVTVATGRNDILEGVQLGFSDEFEVGDRAAVIVSTEQGPNALTFGGRLGVSLQFDIRAQDTPTAEKISDKLVEILWGVMKPQLKDEGLDVTAVNVGGESSEAEDEIGQEWAFMFSISAEIEGEWQVRIPLLRRYSYGVVNLPSNIDIYSATDIELIESSFQELGDYKLGIDWSPS